VPLPPTAPVPANRAFVASVADAAEHDGFKVYFPRLILPFSAVLSGLVDFGVSFLMFVVIMIYYRMHATAAMLMLPLFLLLAVLTALGVGLWLSALNAIYRDVRYVVPFLVQFWMFASPVAYPSSLVPAKWRPLYGLNPMAGVIEGFRWSLSGSGNPPGRMLLDIVRGEPVLFRRDKDLEEAPCPAGQLS